MILDIGAEHNSVVPGIFFILTEEPCTPPLSNFFDEEFLIFMQLNYFESNDVIIFVVSTIKYQK